jgi:hypothetical protein
MTQPTDLFNDAVRAWSSLATAWPGASAATAGTAAAAPSSLDTLLMQAQWLGSASLLRSGQRAAQSWLQFTQAAPADAPQALRVDEARAHLRRLAEIAADEARTLEQQLRGLDEQARGLVAPAEPEPAPVRRAQAKT